MTYFANYEAARTNSTMIFENDLAAAIATYIAATGGKGDTGASTRTLVASVATADTNHADRLSAAGDAFSISNSSRGDKKAAHAATWLATGAPSG